MSTGAAERGATAGLPVPEVPLGLDSPESAPAGYEVGNTLTALVKKAPAAQVVDQLTAVVDRFLQRVGNWLAGFPANPLTGFLEGALLLLRRTLFNQDPDVTPVQEMTTSGLIQGSIGAVDPDADPLRYEVVVGPELGSVTVDEYGDYFYVPGADYAGADSFVVEVSTKRAGINVLDPFGAGSRAVTVLVGAGAPTNPFEGEERDPIPATLFLGGAAGSFTLTRKPGLAGALGQFGASVTLDVSSDTPLAVLDAEGRGGDDEITVGEILVLPGVESLWDEFEAADYDGVMLGVDFSQDGEDYTLILTDVQPGQNSDGQYVLTGSLALNPPWDLVGSAFQPGFETFLASYTKGAGSLTGTFADADFYVDSYAPTTYANQLVGTDPGIPALTYLAAEPSTPAASSGVIDPDGLGAAITASLDFGAGFVMGLETGQVWQWTGTQWTELKSEGWKSPVTSIEDFGDGFVVGLENGSVQQWSARRWNELQCGYCSTEWNSPVTAFVALEDDTNKDIGLVVALKDGSLYHHEVDNGDWTKLPDYDLGGGISAMIPFQGGVAVGRTNGTVQFYNNTRCPTCWSEKSPQSYPGSSQVNVLLEYRGGLVAGLNDGSVQQWTGSEWKELQDTGWGSAVWKMVGYQDGFVVGLRDSALEYYTGTEWIELHDGSWSSPLEAMISYRTGIVAGLNNGTVQLWAPPVPVGADPAGVAFGPNGPLAYVANTGSDTVSVIDTATRTVTGTIEVGVGSNPIGVVVGDASYWSSPALFVANSGSNTVSVIDTATQKVTKTVQVGERPAGIAISERGGTPVVYVANEGSNSVTRYDTLSGATKTIAVGENPTAVTVAPNGETAYVTNLGSASLSVIDLLSDTVTSTIENVGPAPLGVAFSPDGARAYVTHLNPGGSGTSLSVIDTATRKVTATLTGIGTGIGPSALGLPAVGPKGTRLYITNAFGKKVTVLDVGKLDAVGGVVKLADSGVALTSVDVAGEPAGIAVSPDGGYVYVTKKGAAGTVSVIDTDTYVDLTEGVGANGVRELKGFGWNSPVSVIDESGNSFVVGLQSGMVQQWAEPGWTELKGASEKFGTEKLKEAVTFVRGGGEALSADDPIFSEARYLPACKIRDACDGSFYPLTLNYLNPPKSLAGKSFPVPNGPSLDLSLDVGAAIYGYAYVPGGVWKKLNTKKYSTAFLVALPAGPSTKLNLAGNDGLLSIPETELVSGTPFYQATAYGTIQVDAAVTAGLEVNLELGDTSVSTDTLSARAYYVPGFILTLNTASQGGLGFYYDAYPDVDFTEFVDYFSNVVGVSVKPTVTPSITGRYGLVAKKDWPIIGGLSVAEINLSYQNPVSVTLTLAKDTDPSLVLDSSGTLTYGAGILGALTSALTFNGEQEIYSVSTDNLLSPSSV